MAVLLRQLNHEYEEDDNTLKPIPSFLGFVSFRHIWNQTLRSNLNLSGISVTNDSQIAGDKVNRSAWSISGNVLYSPAKPLIFGLELMHAAREIEDGTKGSFIRLQFSAKYAFNFTSTIN